MVVTTRKCRYALRAVLELSKRRGAGPVSVREIARKQAIPRRFLEDILNLLKNAKLVRAYRGVRGGYELVCAPDQLTVGQIIRLLDGPMLYAECTNCNGDQNCPLRARCPFIEVWQDAESSLSSVLNSVTFQELVNRSAESTIG